MPTITAGVFTLNYTLFTNAHPGADIQFGMDFTLTTTGRKPLCQVIFPATAVGTNRPGQWNIDNHRAPGTPDSLVFTGAEHGTITDGPREIGRGGSGVKNTKFAVYIVDIAAATVQSAGVQFGYSINPSVPNPQTTLTGFTTCTLTNEQKDFMKDRCSYIKFV